MKKISVVLTLLLVVAFSFSYGQADEVRRWTAQGESVDGEFIELIVRIRKTDGTFTRVPLEKLSQKDQEYVKGKMENRFENQRGRVKLGEAETYAYGVTFAAPEGWRLEPRRRGFVVCFTNPLLKGQCVYVKTPEKSEIQTLETEEDVQKEGLRGKLIKIGKYYWVSKSQRSVDSKTEDEYDNLVCETVQFGRKYRVTVRGPRRQNENCEEIMNAVLSRIEFREDFEFSEDFEVDF